MTIVITKGDNPGNYIYVDVNGWFRYTTHASDFMRPRMTLNNIPTPTP